MNEWNIQSRAHRCQACDQPFEGKKPYHTLLFDEKHAYLRRDICTVCWQKDYQNQEREKGFISYWQGTYELPPPPIEPIQKKTAEALLRKLIEINNPKFASAGYILAVMLERKRLLKVKEQLTRDGQRWFVYEQPNTGDIFTIADPSLQLGELEEVQRTVASLLEHGLTPEGEIALPSEPIPAEKPTAEIEPKEESDIPAEDPSKEPEDAHLTG